LPLPPSLTPVQLAFLVSLLPGPRPTDDCHDAITVGGLVRPNLVAWDVPNHRPDGRRRRSTFALTEAGTRLLAGRVPHGLAGVAGRT
jgi:hypothetical protein